MTQGVTIKTFAVVQKHSPAIQLLHSVSKFADAEGPPELTTGKERGLGLHSR